MVNNSCSCSRVYDFSSSKDLTIVFLHFFFYLFPLLGLLPFHPDCLMSYPSHLLLHWCPVLSHFTTLVQSIYIYDGIFVSSTTYSLIFHFFPKFSTSSEFNKDLPPPNCENFFNFSLPHFIDIELKTLETVYCLKRRLIEFPALLNKAIMSIYTLLQSFTIYSRLTPVFMRNSALREKFNFYFSRAFC